MPGSNYNFGTPFLSFGLSLDSGGSVAFVQVFFRPVLADCSYRRRRNLSLSYNRFATHSSHSLGINFIGVNNRSRPARRPLGDPSRICAALAAV